MKSHSLSRIRLNGTCANDTARWVEIGTNVKQSWSSKPTAPTAPTSPTDIPLRPSRRHIGQLLADLAVMRRTS